MALGIWLTIGGVSLGALSLYAAQPAPTAAALGQANVRAAPDVTSALVGEITAGTRYPILARSQFLPWLLIGDTVMQPIGWVFRDLVDVQGDLNAVPFSEAPVNVLVPTPSPAPAANTTPIAITPNAPVSAGISSVVGLVNGEINIRYEPRVDAQRVGVGRAGDRLPIVRWHTGLPWVEVAYPPSPTGTAWVLLELLQVEGDIFTLPSTSQTTFALPTLTPTPSALEIVELAGVPNVPISPAFQALGDQLWSMMLGGGFDPATSRLGGLFLMNVDTGEALSFGGDIAFSGMSISKVSILTTLYSQLNAPPNDEQAFAIAETMICSENIYTNRILAVIGGGNPYTGAEQVSAFLQQLGLENTFIYTPYALDPNITPQAPRTRITDADQVSAQPDPYNQMTVAETGALLNSLYQCGYNESGALIDNFNGEFTPTECRQMLNVMSYNEIGALIEAGIPADTRVAHKHGWIDDTHGDAALVFTPGGTYILVTALHNPIWLNFDESEPLIAEMSRAVYNAFNANAPMLTARNEVVPATCDLLGSPVIDELMAFEFTR
ncbi:MAG: serine hydrolase [Chloroflexota bacterium]|nr:serine hydrolase [Chloroflexota bacterium]